MTMYVIFTTNMIYIYTVTDKEILLMMLVFMKFILKTLMKLMSWSLMLRILAFYLYY